MKHFAICLTVVTAGHLCFAQAQQTTESPQQGAAEPTSDDSVIRRQLREYVDTFNSHDAKRVGACWTEDAESVDDETGERTTGRTAITEDFAAFFKDNPDVRLAAELTSLKKVHPDIALAEGRTTLFVSDAEPVESAFSAVLVRQGDRWLLSSTHERSLPVPLSSHDALQQLDWLVGTWQDDASEGQVTSTVRWSPGGAFLIRSFRAGLSDDDALQGTQVFGWDPSSQQIRTWMFSSDGMFGQGTVARHDEEWSIRMTQVLPDGRIATGTRVITPVDSDTLTFQIVGHTLDGQPVPSGEPVTVVRTGGVQDAVSNADNTTQEGAAP